MTPPLGATTALVLSAVVGAIAASFATALSAWFVSSRLEKSAARRRLLDSIAVVLAELEDNRTAIEDYEHGHLQVASLQNGMVTIGDWTVNKRQLAALAHDDEPLWRELAQVYSDLHKTIRRGRVPPNASRLQELELRLASRTD